MFVWLHCVKLMITGYGWFLRLIIILYCCNLKLLIFAIIIEPGQPASPYSLTWLYTVVQVLILAGIFLVFWEHDSYPWNWEFWQCFVNNLEKYMTAIMQ